jgi:hypothetical protein
MAGAAGAGGGAFRQAASVTHSRTAPVRRRRGRLVRVGIAPDDRSRQSLLSMRAFAAAVALTVAVAAPPARADGALPDSLSILTPAGRPHDIALATNFGLVLSHDDGRRWVWSCEQAGNAYGILYQVGPAPRNRIFTISTDQHGVPQLGFSDDDSCTWGVATLADAPAPVVDAFPDPDDADRVLAVAVAPTDGGSVYQVRASNDGGATLPTLLYTAAGGDFITGLEIARGAPNTIVLTMGSGVPSMPVLVRSTDGGSHWESHGLEGLGANVTVRLFAIDAQDPSRVFLRAGGGVNDSVAVATIDAASVLTVTTTLPFYNGVITSFARLANGHLFVGGTIGVAPVAFLSVDGGVSFQPLPPPPPLKGASARGDTLYAVTDETVAGFAIATSADEGQSWQPLMRYDQIAAIQGCAAALCQEDCAARATRAQWSTAFCAAPDPTAAPAGGGCGCTAAGATHVQGLVWFVVAAVLAAATRRLLRAGRFRVSIRP